MSDLISRKDAINALVEKGQSSKRYRLGDIWELNLSEIEEALDALPSAEPEPKWIPVTEALLEERKNVLVTTIDSDIKVSYRSDVTYWWNIGRGNVLAWMPLPESWRGE